MSLNSVLNIGSWIEENKKDFVPPVCNKCMFSDQLKVFFVGGPNIRKDYHLEEGEEFFYQLKGDMCLKVIEGGKYKDIVIKEGEIFMLPSKTHHSPQRFENTIGMVVERRREQEWDSLCYFVGNTLDVLYERWLHLKDIVKDLPPIIKGYFASEAHKTGKPAADSIIMKRPFEPDYSLKLIEPFNFDDWIDDNQEEIMSKGKVTLFGPPDFVSQIFVFGFGTHNLQASAWETFILQKRGVTTLKIDGVIKELNEKDVINVPEGVKITMDIADSHSFALLLRMPEK